MSTSTFTAARRLRLAPVPPAVQHLHVGRSVDVGAAVAVPRRVVRIRPTTSLAPPFPFSAPVVGVVVSPRTAAVVVTH